MGSASGRNGSYLCNAWADPDGDLVFVHLTDPPPSRAAGARHQTQDQ